MRIVHPARSSSTPDDATIGTFHSVRCGFKALIDLPDSTKRAARVRE